MVNIYQCHYSFSNFDSLLFFPVFVCFFCLIKKYYFANREIKIQEDKRDKVKKAVIIWMLFVWGTIELFHVYILLKDHYYIYMPYKQNKYSVVEGYTQDYHTGSVNETFKVNGVDFFYRSINAQIGYTKIREEGGKIRKNNQHVIIEYIDTDYRGNVIVGVWIEEADENY